MIPTDKGKEVCFRLKKWQAGMLVSVFAIAFSYFMAASCHEHQGLLTIFYMLGMIASGAVGVVFFVVSLQNMWEKWDA